jgi:SPP1 gp7 family putative phage head morphogenesis protein
MFTFSPMPHSEAVSRIAGLPLVSREVMDELLPELRAYAFTVTGLDRFDQLAKVRDVIAAVPAGEQTWAKARKEIAAELSEDLGGKVAQRRAELLLRTHVFRSYAASRYRRLMQQVDVFPFWQYKTHGDGNVRPSHAALNGKIFPAGHDIWQRIFPPWDWGCRCLVVPLTKRSAEKQSADPSARFKRFPIAQDRLKICQSFASDADRRRQR